MKSKKLISAMIIFTLMVAQFSFLSILAPKVTFAAGPEAKSENVADKYFYDQLDDDSKVFYDIFDEMFFGCDYNKLKTELSKPETTFGVDSKDVTDKLTTEGLKNKLQAYTKGNQDLLNTMGAARDAYFADHAGLFFVDPDYITLRVLSQGGSLKVFLGNGRSKTYINKAFWDYDKNKVKVEDLKTAIDAVKNELDKAVKEVNDVTAGADENETIKKIEKAHDIIIRANAYKLEETIIEENYKIDHNKAEGEKGDPWNVRTVYGAFGPKHEIVCEGFARAFKMILDRVNIPCVLVYGAYTSSTRYEEHMWNYVLVDNKWYGVDTTWDNTDRKDTDASLDEKEKEKVSYQYFLAGEDIMNLNHTVTGIMSASNKEFKYPAIEKSSDKYELASEIAGLRVELDADSYDSEDDIKAAKIKISYFIDLNENGVEDPGERMGYKKAKEHGYYLLSSMMSYKIPEQTTHVKPFNFGEEGWNYNGYFAYINPDIYGAINDFYDDGSEVKDGDGVTNKNSYVSFYNANCNYMQFGVTTEKPLEYYPEIKKDEIRKMTTYFGTSSDMVALSDKIHNPAGEYVKPPYIESASPVQNSTMIIEEGPYEVKIVYDEKLVPIEDETIEAHVTIDNSSNTQDNNYELTDFKFDNDRTITFKFKPSNLYADDSVYYTIDMLGLMGEKSHKRPMAASYFCAHKCSAYAFKSQGFDWNVYGKPQLMDDASLNDLTNFEELSDEEGGDLSQLLKHRMTLVTETTKPSEEKEMNKLLENNDDLTAGGEVVETQTYNIKLTLCKMQKIQNGQKVRIMLGFPDGYGPEDAGVTFKAYHYSKDASGRIIGVNEIPCMVTELGLIIECDAFSPFAIAAIQGAEVEDTSKTVIFQSNEGGDIYIDGKLADSVKFDEKASEKAKDQVTITVKPIDGYVVDDIVIGEKVVDVNGDDVEKVSAVAGSNEITYTIKYDDLKDQAGSAMVAKVAFIPEEIKKEEKEQGLELVAQPLVQASFTLEAEVKKDGEALGDGVLDEGEEFEVEYKISDMKSVGKQGIKGLGALLSYDRQKLQCEEVVAGDGWKVQYNKEDSGERHNIVATYKIEDNIMKALASPDDGNEDQIGNVVFKAKFMVLENENTTEEIKLSHIEAGTGIKDSADVKANDVITSVKIEKLETPPVEEKLDNAEGSNFIITDTLVEGVEVGETVESLRAKLSSGSVLPINFFKKVDGSEDLHELSEADKIGTGTIIKVGEHEWTVVVRADLDGDGELKVNDISLFKLDYIGENKLDGVYLLATEMDTYKEEMNQTDINDLVLMIYEYNDKEMED